MSPTTLVTHRRLLATDLDGTLVGDSGMRGPLQAEIAALRTEMALVYVTGRSLVSTLRLIDAVGLLKPDVIVAGVGTAIHRGPDWQADATWLARLAVDWHVGRVRDLAGQQPELTPQPPGEQTPLKCSYLLQPGDSRRVLARLRRQLNRAGLQARLVYSAGRYLDILPRQAGKATAVRHLADRWQVPWADVMVCGDSGNDRDMLRLPARAVIVGNAGDALRRTPPPGAFLATGHDAAGILEGLQHFGWLPLARELTS